jgi:hypothetical protein
MLGSVHAGERAAAAQKANQFLKDRNLTWKDILQQKPAGPQQRRITPHWTEVPKTDVEWMEAFQTECWDILSDWEREFVQSVLDRNHWPLSPKQRDVVHRMKSKYCQPYA